MGIAGRQHVVYLLVQGCLLQITPEQEAMLINVIGYVGTMRRNPAGGVGDMLKVSIKKVHLPHADKCSMR